MLITENQLDDWVRRNNRDAQGVIVELVWRLVAASAPRPRERRFPLGDSIDQHGPDGLLDVDIPFDPFVPKGRSYWEIGVGLKPGAKATQDYNHLVAEVPQATRHESSFVFVTPLSGARSWEFTWKKGAQAAWLQRRRKRNDWQDVRVIDGTKLIDWLDGFPAVESWLAQELDFPVKQIETLEQRWNWLRLIGDPPPLTPRIFLVNRASACASVREVLARATVELRLDTQFPDQVVDFVAACVADMTEEDWVEAVGRCVVISGVDGWHAMVATSGQHFLVAGPELDLAGPNGPRLLEMARRAGHAVIYGGMPGGIPHPNRQSIPSPKTYQIEEALRKSGYSAERARTLAHKSGGNLNSLVRCIRNLSLMPEWAQGTPAAELKIAVLLASWDESSEGDKAVIRGISGKGYGEWIGPVREVALRPGTPLTQQDGVWKFRSQYEGWYALGPRLFDDDLDRLRTAAIRVLRERDPKFELPPEERYAASIHGKVLAHSRSLRNGLAETLALLGSHQRPLTSCSLGKANSTAVVAVREILGDADWVVWASLNEVLPLLAEAAPTEFLHAVENALNNDPCPFNDLFAQEATGIMGSTYMSGLLWALETLAWDAEYLTPVVVILGELAARDPGGTWANRPANSLVTILLPWLPQTCAPIERRATSVETLQNELPDVAWKLLLDLLPQSHQVSTGTYRPVWRELIADDWSGGVTRGDYETQVTLYAQLAIRAARTDLAKLTALIDRLADLPQGAREQLLGHLGSEAVTSLSEMDRLGLWNQMLDLVAKHKRFQDAEWAMNAELVDRISSLAKLLAPEAPSLVYQRLFSERDFNLYEMEGSYEQYTAQLELRRQEAVREVAAAGGVHGVLQFVMVVESPWRVGLGFGAVAATDAEKEILPRLLDTEQKALSQFAGGFVLGRFRSQSWSWVDQLRTSAWSPVQIGQYLAFLPFKADTWDRAVRLLGNDVMQYWTRTTANPYEAERDLELAVDRLIDHGRPHAAIRCLHKMLRDKRPLDIPRAVRALRAAVSSTEGTHAIDAHMVVEIIKALQDDASTHPDDLFELEWRYLPLLEQDATAYPKSLEHRLANDPSFFCEVIRLIYRSKKDEHPNETPTDREKMMATNAFKLLRGWRIPPGFKKDGAFDGLELAAWLKAVKAECNETGHIEVALETVGQVLTHAPVDPDGLWIHRSAAETLNAKDADIMREGFRIQLFNSRGAYLSDAGKSERAFSSKYRSEADAVEADGFHRLARTLRELAASYARDAERESSRDPFGD